MTKVLVLGSTGMLGSAVEKVLKSRGLDVLVASRTNGLMFDATALKTDRLLNSGGLGSGDFVVNCIGLTKSRIDENSINSRALAVSLNIDFPNALARSAEDLKVKVLQVATDCVFSGIRGSYSEEDAHDPLDVYGKTKSLGESPSNNVMHLRCSLIGPEIGRSSLFYEWVRNQPRNAEIEGYTNHLWNGLSSVAFGKIVAGIIQADLFKAGLQHLVPSGIVTKDSLVRTELASLGRGDVKVDPIASPVSVDRTLTTIHTKLNADLFAAAGYSSLPDIPFMVNELSSQLAD